MNTSFAGNQVGSIVSLDIINSYPNGLLAQLGPYYNDSQGLISAQLTYTANQADITSQQGAAYAQRNLEQENSGTLPPTSLDAVSAQSIYINGANRVNYDNQNLVTRLNAEYTNAYAIEKSCRDASYSAFLTTEATQVRLDRISTFSTVVQLGNTPITVNPMYMIFPSTISTMVASAVQTSNQDVKDASGNVQAYLTKTQTLLNNTIIKSTSVSANRTLVLAFNTLVKAVAEAVSFPLLEIAGKETLVTQYIPSITLTVAIQLVNKAQTFLTALLSNTITNEVTSANSYANTLDSIARSNDLNMYKQEKLQNILKDAASARPRYATPTSNNPISAYNFITQQTAAAAANASAVERLKNAILTDASGNIVAPESAIVAIAAAAAAISPIAARTLALNADESAANARVVSNAIANLNTAYTNATTKEPIILTTATESLSLITSILSTITKVTSNSSAHSAVAITRRASNTIQGILKMATETEQASLESATDSLSVLTLLNTAYSLTPTITDITGIQNKLWAINAATARAKEVAEKLKEKVYLLNRTAYNLVTPQRIAAQTASANAAGALNANYTSRLDRASKNVYTAPPPAYNGFKAGIRANIPVPIRPTLDELVYKNRIEPVRLDSLRTIPEVIVKVAQEVQQIRDNSAFSYRQQ
jgi:hypothetical protein